MAEVEIYKIPEGPQPCTMASRGYTGGRALTRWRDQFQLSCQYKILYCDEALGVECYIKVIPSDNNG